MESRRKKIKPNNEQLNYGKIIASDVNETFEGAMSALFLQPFVPLIASPGWNAVVQGMIPSVLKISSEIMHSVSTNEGAFGHGLFNKDVATRLWNSTPEIFLAGAGGALAYNTGLNGMATCILGGVSGIYFGKGIRIILSLWSDSCGYANNKSEIIHEPNVFQKSLNYAHHAWNGFSVSNMMNYGLTYFNCPIPNPAIQIVMQGVGALVSEGRECLTSEKSLRQQLNLPPTKAAQANKVQASESNTEQLGTIQNYNQNKNPESLQPQTSPQYSTSVKAAVKTVAHVGAVCLGWGVGYAVTNYIYGMNVSPENINGYNATAAGIAMATQVITRTAINSVGYGLSKAAKIGVTWFSCGSKSETNEKQGLINGMESRAETPRGTL